MSYFKVTGIGTTSIYFRNNVMVRATLLKHGNLLDRTVGSWAGNNTVEDGTRNG